MYAVTHQRAHPGGIVGLLVAGAAMLGGLAYLIFADNPVRNVVLTAIRTPQSVLDAVASVDPEHNPDLQPGANGGTTWCNKFLYLVLRKLGITIPWSTYGTQVDSMIQYFQSGADGWTQVPDANAALLATLGGAVAIVTYYNPSGSGHGALILPIDDGSGTVYTAQAGAFNRNQTTINAGFGSLPVQFFIHS